MSQGYSYVPPTLDEAIKAYRRAKKKAELVDSFSKQRYQPKRSLHALPPKEEIVPHPQRYPRRRGYSHGNISEVDDLDDNETVYEFPPRNKLHQKIRRSQNVAPPNANTVMPTYSFPAWSHGYHGNGNAGYPGNSNNPYQPMPPPYPNMFLPQPFPNISVMPGPYGMFPQYVPQQQHPYNFQQQPYNTQYNMQPAERMDYRDFQRDCKYSPAPSRPYSDSDLLEALSNKGKGFRDSDRFTVIPPIQKMDKHDAAQVIQRNFRGYRERKRSGKIKDKFYVDFVDKMIDDVLVEELLPDLLVEVLLYGAKDVTLPSVTERVVREHAEDLMNECVHEMLHSTINIVMSEMISVYSSDNVKNKQGDMMLYVIDELISLQIREVVQEFMKEYILEFQCERVYNQLVYEVCSVLVYEVCKEEGIVKSPIEEVPQNKSKPPFDLDKIILSSVLCKSLVPNEDYLLDSIIAQGIANQLRLDNHAPTT